MLSRSDHVCQFLNSEYLARRFKVTYSLTGINYTSSRYYLTTVDDILQYFLTALRYVCILTAPEPDAGTIFNHHTVPARYSR